jgi:hypothetical protein
MPFDLEKNDPSIERIHHKAFLNCSSMAAASTIDNERWMINELR